MRGFIGFRGVDAATMKAPMASWPRMAISIIGSRSQCWASIICCSIAVSIAQSPKSQQTASGGG
jgi:hypothetical protein